MNFAIIVAAGRGKRFGKDKIFSLLLNKPLIYHTIKKFQDCKLINEIIIVTQKSNFSKINEIKNQYKLSKIKKITEGGKERQDSVFNGLKSLKAKPSDIVVVHNATNPLVKEEEIIECINAAKKYGAAVAGFPLKDTIKKIKNGFVEKTLDRKEIFQVQTPQAVQYGLLVDAFSNAKKKNLKFTDDVSMVESLGKKAKLVACSYKNFKITTQEDLRIAEAIMKEGIMPRMGFGHDSHQFSLDENKKLVLGGFIVPNEIGLEANSDGDLILHALFNAVSSAIGERSLSHYADPMFGRGVTDSSEYLKVILDKLIQKNLKITNVSVSIEALKPRLEPYTGKITDSLSKILDLGKESIGITYTTGEKLTSFGQGKGMQCFAIVTIA